MQYKSYLIENNLNTLRENLVLLYENLGLKNDFKKKIKHLHKSQFEIINLIQEDVITSNFLLKEVSNISLLKKFL